MSAADEDADEREFARAAAISEIAIETLEHVVPPDCGMVVIVVGPGGHTAAASGLHGENDREILIEVLRNVLERAEAEGPDEVRQTPFPS